MFVVSCLFFAVVIQKWRHVECVCFACVEQLLCESFVNEVLPFGLADNWICCVMIFALFARVMLHREDSEFLPTL